MLVRLDLPSQIIKDDNGDDNYRLIIIPIIFLALFGGDARTAPFVDHAIEND